MMMVLVCLFLMGLAGAPLAAAAPYPFFDDFEGGLSQWSAAAPWGLTTASYSSPAYSVTDSPSSLYGNSVDAALTLGSAMDLSGAVAPALAFHHRFQLETGYDYGYVEISTDGGASWTAPLATYTGAQGTWVRDQIDLSGFAGASDVRVRFRLVTDGTVPADGWYLDDVTVGEAPAPVTQFLPSAPSPNAVDLSWTSSSDPDFLSYTIYRSTTTPVDWRTAKVVAEIADSATTAYTDISVTP